MQVGGSGCELLAVSCLQQDEILFASSNASLWQMQGEKSAGGFGKSLETVMVSHRVDGELSSPASVSRELNEASVSPTTWQRASTRLTRVSCWILSLSFSSWSLAKASARGTTWVVASSKRVSTHFPKPRRSLWISLTAHRSINSNFLLQKGSSSSSASSRGSKSLIICSRPDLAQTLSGLPRASAAAEAGRRSRFTPGMAKGLKGPALVGLCPSVCLWGLYTLSKCPLSGYQNPNNQWASREFCFPRQRLHHPLFPGAIDLFISCSTVIPLSRSALGHWWRPA